MAFDCGMEMVVSKIHNAYNGPCINCLPLNRAAGSWDTLLYAQVIVRQTGSFTSRRLEYMTDSMNGNDMVLLCYAMQHGFPVPYLP